MECHNRLSDIRQGDIPRLTILLLVTLHWTTLKSIIATWDCFDEKPEGYHHQEQIESQ